MKNQEIGTIRHIIVKIGIKTNEIMCIIVSNENIFKNEKQLTERIISKFPNVKTIIKNVNNKNTNVILGDKDEVLYGDGFICDKLGEYTFKISAKSFYQTNPIQTEVLYSKAIEFAKLNKEDVLCDLYCGIGTIGIFASDKVKKVYGIEIVEEAAEAAKENAKLNNVNNIEYFKSLLDNCASPPNSGGYGSTFLFTSNFPHLIHPDFRKGKIDKFEIPRPQDNENANILIENITRCKDSLINIKDYPDCLARKLNILEDLNKKNFTDNDYNEINKICKTDEQLGAFNYDDLYKIALTSCLKSINPKNSISGKEVLYYELIHTPRSFTPKMIIRQNKISNLVNNKQNMFQILCGKEELGIITNKEQLLLDELKIKRKNDLVSLTEKEKTGNLNDFEKDYLEELRTYEE